MVGNRFRTWILKGHASAWCARNDDLVAWTSSSLPPTVSTYPFVSAALLSPTREDVQSTLRDLKRYGKLLTSVVSRNGWMSYRCQLACGSGRSFVSLLENAWQKVPHWLHDELAESFPRLKIVPVCSKCPLERDENLRIVHVTDVRGLVRLAHPGCCARSGRPRIRCSRFFGVPHVHAISYPGVLRQECSPWAHDSLRVFGRLHLCRPKSTLELEIPEILIRELIADTADEDVQRLSELRNEKKAHELQSMITAELKENSCKRPWTLTKPQLWRKSSGLLRNRGRQRSARCAVLPQLWKRETCQSPRLQARPLQVSQQLPTGGIPGSGDGGIPDRCSREVCGAMGRYAA